MERQEPRTAPRQEFNHAPPAVDARWRAKEAATPLAADAHAQWGGILAR